MINSKHQNYRNIEDVMCYTQINIHGQSTTIIKIAYPKNTNGIYSRQLSINNVSTVTITDATSV